MGGLDCRFLVSQLQPTTFKVASLTVRRLVNCTFEITWVDEMAGRRSRHRIVGAVSPTISFTTLSPVGHPLPFLCVYDPDP